ncbi:low affinity immunoglobulin gamma Fc region receptor II-a-like [Lates calcarifer]|uniref:low affinity immunoglobulin gamma Fc region receptor II-a-like n=1 Tax=Lates calcarifer TaxID=8187 RepID=UPI0021D7C1A3|nr:low affinity immunoglobulin gamma Fc region receptor II-a-like [Lates calcarifer]
MKRTSMESSWIIDTAYPSDSGEYWCETKEGERSNSVSITVTDGSVILESPAHPVMQGYAVTLRCRNKAKTTNLRADFYKDGQLMNNSPAREMIINNVSKLDEGLYRCNISGVGTSPESRLTVTAPQRDICPPSDHSTHIYLILRTVFTIVMVALLLLLLGLMHCGKLRVTHR